MVTTVESTQTISITVLYIAFFLFTLSNFLPKIHHPWAIVRFLSTRWLTLKPAASGQMTFATVKLILERGPGVYIYAKETYSGMTENEFVVNRYLKLLRLLSSGC